MTARRRQIRRRQGGEIIGGRKQRQGYGAHCDARHAGAAEQVASEKPFTAAAPGRTVRELLDAR
jgi:hypothetical protein